MSKQEKNVIEDIKETAKESVEKVKEFAHEVESDVHENRDFKRFSTRVRRLNTKLINFESALYGVFNQIELTLTYRIKDDFSVNELVEISGNTYQILDIDEKVMMFPMMIDGTKHEVECKVASLKALEQVV